MQTTLRRRWPYILVVVIAVLAVVGQFESQDSQTRILKGEIQKLDQKVQDLERQLHARPST
jgi:hypothetical protein